MNGFAILAKMNEITNSPKLEGNPKVAPSEVAEVVVIGILLVFFILLLITLIMTVFPYIFGNKSKNNKSESIIDKVSNNSELSTNLVEPDDGELISVITAAVAAYRSSSGEESSLSSFKVVAFKKSTHR